MDSIKTGKFIADRRRQLGLTQQQLADKLNVSFQAISKWETGSTYPNIELLRTLALVLDVTADEILAGAEQADEAISYSKAGVDITYTDSIKKDMAKHLESKDTRVLNSLGQFASLYDINFPNIKNPVLVLKAEEPGSKQNGVWLHRVYMSRYDKPPCERHCGYGRSPSCSSRYNHLRKRRKGYDKHSCERHFRCLPRKRVFPCRW